MAEKTRVLVLDDEHEWRQILSEVVQAIACEPVLAKSEPEAQSLVDDERFPVALVDLALTSDSTDRGGLRVMERMRRWHDTTSAIILTAHGDIEEGAAVKEEFGVVTALAKRSFDEDRTRRIIATEVQRWSVAPPQFIDAWVVLRGTEDAMIWESRMLDLCGSGVTAGDFRGLIAKAVTSVWPLIPRLEQVPMERAADERFASGVFWSRAEATPTIVLIGQGDAVEEALEQGCACERALDGNRLFVRRQRGASRSVGAVIGVRTPSSIRDSFARV